MSYCNLVLRLNPLLPKTFGFLTNYRDFIFFCAERLTSGSVKFYETGVIPQQQGFEFLVQMLEEPSLSEIPYIPNLTPISFIGSGATSHAFSCWYKQGDYVMKCFRQESEKAFWNEKSMLEIMQEKVQQGVPRLVLSDVLCLVISPLGEPFRDNHVTLDNVRALIKTLRQVHLCKIIHRDIRPPNLVFDTHSNYPIIIDWGFATTFPDTIETTQVDFDVPKKKDTTPGDDLVSLFKSCFVVLNGLTKVPHIHNPKFWNFAVDVTSMAASHNPDYKLFELKCIELLF